MIESELTSVAAKRSWGTLPDSNFRSCPSVVGLAPLSAVEPPLVGCV
jgi:hypothetical protein